MLTTVMAGLRPDLEATMRIRALLILALALACAPAFSASIALRPGATWTERAAAGDLQRVIYAATGKFLPIGALKSTDRDVIALGFSPVGGVDLSAKRLGDQGFALKTVKQGRRTILIAAGANPVSTSYAAYTLAERYGAGFYLGGDALPTKRVAYAISKLDETRKPVFKVRGVLPWYNFFDSPTAWNIEDYRSFIDQLAKSKNNFLGFHSYDHEPFCAYPDADGKMVAGEPLVSTAQPTWGTAPMPTSDFAPTARGYFEKPYFGADCSMGYASREEGIKNAQKLLAKALLYAKARGVKTCVGFEVTGDPTTPGDLDRLEQRLKNLLKTYPMLDYVWIWEPEAMGLHGIDPRGIRTDFGAYARRWDSAFAYIEDTKRRTEAVRIGIYALAAHRIIRREAPGVRMILSAWGGDNHLRFTDFYPGFDKILPKDIIFSALDNIVVSDTVSAAYGKLSKDREFWPIPWFEYDGDQWCPQPNTKRFYNASRDAMSKGASGLLGIHWRTRDVEESHAYISEFAWNPKLGYEQFYRDYARRAYGDPNAAKLLMDLQDLGWRWLGGGGQTECGGFEWNPAPDGAVGRMRGVFAKCPPLQPSARLDDLLYMREWLASYDQTAGILSSNGQVRSLLRQLRAENRQPTDSERSLISQQLRSARTALSAAISSAAMRVSNRGELGILATINTKAWASLLAIEKEAGAFGVQADSMKLPIPAALDVRSILPLDTAFAGQSLRVSAVVHDASPKAEAEVCYRGPGGKAFDVAPLRFVSPGRLEGRIPTPSVGLVEYYIRVLDGPDSAVWPSRVPSAFAYASVVPAPLLARSQAAAALKHRKGVAAVASGPMLVEVSWADAPRIPVFEVVRSANGGDWSRIATVRDNWFEDRAVEVGSRYRYRILDADTSELVAESPVAAAGRPLLPSAPTVSVVAGPARVRLIWKADDANASGYRVYRSAGADGPFVAPEREIAQFSVQGTQTCVWPAVPGETMHYLVRAVSLDGREGPASKPVAETAIAVDTKPILSLDFDRADSITLANHTVEQGIACMRTTADSYVELPHKDAFNPDGEITIAFWVKLRSPGVMPVFVSHGAWDQDGFFVQQFAGRVRFQLAGIGTLDAGQIELNRWTSVAATYDGAEMAIYLDGRKVGSQPAVGIIRPNARPLYVGRYEYLAKDFEVDGWIGRTRLYGYALSADAIKADYDRTAANLSPAR